MLADKGGDARGSRGYGFVAYHDLQSAQTAINTLSTAQLAGRTLRLGFAEDRERPGEQSDACSHTAAHQ